MKKTAEETLREYAQTLNVSMRDLRGIVLQTYIDDENFQKRQHEALQNQVQMKQLRLVDIETSYRGTELYLLQRKQQRVMWRIKQWDRIKKLFTKKTKSDEPGK